MGDYGMIVQIVLKRLPDGSLRIIEMSRGATEREHKLDQNIGPVKTAEYIERLLVSLVALEDAA